MSSLSHAQAGWISGIFFAGYTAVVPFLVSLTDRVDPRRVYLASTAITVVSTLAFALIADGFWTALVCRALGGVGLAGTYMPGLKALTDRAADDQRARISGIYTATYSAAASVSFVFIGVFDDLFGWRWAFVIMGTGFLIMGLLLWKRMEKARRLVPKAVDPVAGNLPFHQKVGDVLRQARARVVLGTVLLEGASAFGVVAMGVTHLHEHQGVSLSLAGLAISMFGLGCLCYAAAARHFILRLGEAGMIHVGTLMFGLPFLWIAWVPEWHSAMLASFISGFGFFMFHNTLQALATQMHPPQRATCMTLFAGTLFSGQSLGVWIAAQLVDRWGTAWVIAMGAVMVMLMGQYIPALLKRTTPRMTAP